MGAFSKMRDAMTGSKSQEKTEAGSPYSTQSPQPDRYAQPRSQRFHLLALIPVLVTATALVLSFLCVFAGHTTTMMQDYAIFTLNSSRIGENFVDKLENKIRSFQFSDIGLRRRDEIVILPATYTTAAPTTLITMAPIAPRGIISQVESLGSKATHHIASDAASLKSEGASEISKATSYVHSKATSLEGAVASEAASLVAKIEDELISLLNEAYHGLIDDMQIEDFYNVHIMASCTGTYEFQNGTNITVGDSGPPAVSGPDSVHQHVDKCEQHSAIDPMSVVKIIYWVGIVHIFIILVTGIAVIFRGFGLKLVFINVFMTMVSFFAIALASTLVHGLALAATKVINFIGSDAGLTAYLGHKFLALTWATTGLLALNTVLWIVLFFVDRRQKSSESLPQEKPSRRDDYAMQDVAHPQSTYRSRY